MDQQVAPEILERVRGQARELYEKHVRHNPVQALAKTREESLALMQSWVTSDALRKHMLAVEAAMIAYAGKFGEDAGRAPQSGILAELAGVRDHGGFDGEHVFAQRVGSDPTLHQRERFLAGLCQRLNWIVPDVLLVQLPGLSADTLKNLWRNLLVHGHAFGGLRPSLSSTAFMSSQTSRLAAGLRSRY